MYSQDALRQHHVRHPVQRHAQVAERLGLELDGQRHTALDLYREGLELRRAIVREFVRTPEALHEVSVSLDRVADAMLAQGVSGLEIDRQRHSALDLYSESFVAPLSGSLAASPRR